MSKPINASRFSKRSPQQYEGMYRWVFFLIGKILCWLFFHTVKQTKALHTNRIPPHTHFIVASNHVSNYDPFIVGSEIWPHHTAFMAKRELFLNPLTRFIMDGFAAICVDRQKVEIATIRSCKVALESKRWCLGIFPEGTRVKEGESREAKKGVAYMAKATGAPVLPVGLVHAGPKKRYITVVFGELIEYEGQDIETFTDLLMERIEALKAEAHQQGPRLHGYPANPGPAPNG